MIKAVIIDDEEIGIANLAALIKKVCPELKIIGTASGVVEGIERIKKLKPDIVFLDIAMGDGDGFEVLDRIHDKTFEVIFTTAHYEFAIRAFNFAALHYLLKPVNPDELIDAVKRYRKLHDNEERNQQYDIFLQGLNNSFNKIALPSLQGITFVDLDKIIRCEASEGYTIFYLLDKSRIVVSRSLNKYEKLLAESFFFRIHDKHLINLKHVKKYLRGKGGSVILTDGFSANVSVRRKDDFLRTISLLAGSV